MNSTRKGDQLEARIAAVLRLFHLPANVKIKHPVLDSTLHNKRKVDVVVIEDNIKIALAVECKNYCRPVEIGDIEKWKTQCDDMEITHRIFVSSSGYQDGAAKKAKAHGITLLRWEKESVTFPRWFCCDSVFVEERKVQPLRANILSERNLHCNLHVTLGEKIFLIDGYKWSLNEVAIDAVSKAERNLSDIHPTYFDRAVHVEFSEGSLICKQGKMFGLKVKSMELNVRIHESSREIPLKVEALRLNNLPKKIAFAFVTDKVYSPDGKECKLFSVLISEVTKQNNRFMRAEWLPA